MRFTGEGTGKGATMRDKPHRASNASVLPLILLYPNPGVEDPHTVGTNKVEVRLFCLLSEQALKPYPFLSIRL